MLTRSASEPEEPAAQQGVDVAAPFHHRSRGNAQIVQRGDEIRCGRGIGLGQVGQTAEILANGRDLAGQIGDDGVQPVDGATQLLAVAVECGRQRAEGGGEVLRRDRLEQGQHGIEHPAHLDGVAGAVLLDLRTVGKSGPAGVLGDLQGHVAFAEQRLRQQPGRDGGRDAFRLCRIEIQRRHHPAALRRRLPHVAPQHAAHLDVRVEGEGVADVVENQAHPNGIVERPRVLGGGETDERGHRDEERQTCEATLHHCGMV